MRYIYILFIIIFLLFPNLVEANRYVNEQCVILTNIISGCYWAGTLNKGRPDLCVAFGEDMKNIFSKYKMSLSTYEMTSYCYSFCFYGTRGLAANYQNDLLELYYLCLRKTN